MKRSTKLILAGGSLALVVGGCSSALSSPSPSVSTSTPPAAAASATEPVFSDPSTDEPIDSATPEPAPQPDKVTFVVKGSSAEVTYGPAGSSLSGSVPMKRR